MDNFYSAHARASYKAPIRHVYHHKKKSHKWKWVCLITFAILVFGYMVYGTPKQVKDACQRIDAKIQGEVK